MEKTLNIYIIRHGEKDKEENGSLTKKGRAQATLLANRLNKLKITKIYSSDLIRCKETAEIISKKIKLPIKYEKALREISSEVKEKPSKHKNKINKIGKFWNKLDKQKGNILLVSSGIVNRILMSFALKINPSKANFMQDNTGFTRLEKNKKKNRYRFWHVNDISHLPNKLRTFRT